MWANFVCCFQLDMDGWRMRYQNAASCPHPAQSARKATGSVGIVKARGSRTGEVETGALRTASELTRVFGATSTVPKN